MNFKGLRKETSISGILITLGALLLLTVSCKRAQNCTPTTRDFAVIQFVDSLGMPKERSFTITSVAADTTLVAASLVNSQFNLPVNPFQNNTTYVFSDLDGEDWMTLGYRNAAFINSEDCGAEFVFSELTIWGTSYDSVRLLNNRLLPGIDVNIRVYD